MYQVLARKYRPRNFNQLVGQTHVSKALTNALERNRLHHAYLFTGTRGVGKTTIARILSKCLNCETGITSTPCEICNTCTAINEGRFIDLIEIDAASRTKVEDTRELLDNVPYAPTQGRYKVYLIDEVHMLSTHSFNALLKTLEEPPEHVKFLLATTDPQKLPVTVLSRCLQFTLRPLPRQEIRDHLADILQREQIVFDEAALWLLAESAQGSLRDALSLTDQAIAYGQGVVAGQDVQDMLGLLDKGQLVHLLAAIHAHDHATVQQILFDLSQQAVDLKAVLDQMISLLHQVALLQCLPTVALAGTPEEQRRLRDLAQRFAATDVQLYYQIAINGRRDLSLAVNMQQGFEMCMLRLLAFAPVPAHQLPIHQVPIADQPPLAVQDIAVQDVAPQDVPQWTEKKTVLNEAGLPQTQHTDINAATETEAITQPTTESTTEAVAEIATENSPHAIAADVEKNPLEPVLPIATAADAANVVVDDGLNHGLDQGLAESLDQQPPNENMSPIHAIEVNAAVDADLLQASLLQVSTVADSPVVEHTPAESAPAKNMTDTPLADVIDFPTRVDLRTATPFEILAHPVAVLSGEWTAEKWEFWLRERDLSPAVRNLAQHGLMRGSIGGENYLQLAPEYNVMAQQTQDGLLYALQDEWPNSRLVIELNAPNQALPVQRKAQRYQQAEARARELVLADAAVLPLVEQLGAELLSVELREP